MTLPADAQAYMLHQPPLRLIQQLLCVEDSHAEAQTTLDVGGVGVGPDGTVEAMALVELVAQTYAAAQGYRDRDEADPVSRGYLVGVSDFQIESRPPAGRPLLVKIDSSCSFDDFYIVEGQVFCDSVVIAGGSLKVWVQPGTGKSA
jgi:3-hydroxyacyl-[acyl-carrier-protein] dehydratase